MTEHERDLLIAKNLIQSIRMLLMAPDDYIHPEPPHERILKWIDQALRLNPNLTQRPAVRANTGANG